MQFFLWCCLMGCSWGMYAQSLPSAQLLERFNHMQTMQAHFVEDIWANNQLISHSTGEMALKKPGLFQWNIKTPTTQRLIADGQRLWYYDEALEQVTVRPEGAVMHSSALFFLKDIHAEALKAYQITYHSAEDCFILNAKDTQADFLKISLFFRQAQLSQMILVDSLGQKTEIRFRNIRVNAQINPKVFRFTPPKGVDVIEEGGASVPSSDFH